MNKNTSFFRRALSLLLCTCLFLPAVPFGNAKAEEKTIEIHSAAEMTAFAAACVDETYSQGLTVELLSSINLTGSGFAPAATFAGTFHGNGNVISGFTLSQEGSTLGFFRTVGEDAVVEDLTVAASIYVTGSARKLGGIAGENRGTITGCAFRGSIVGTDSIGGIAGRNTGTISSCKSYAMLMGDSSVGGIAGENEGRIEDCINKGDVNVSSFSANDSQDSQEISFSLDLKTDSDTMLQEIWPEKTYDIGGIAGMNSGTIKTCSNIAHVGYPSKGYNIGGIAGRTGGVIEACENTGKIFGRKDVGGIAGQLEPVLSIVYDTATADTISGLVDDITTVKDRMLTTVETTGDDTSAITDRIDGLLKDIKDMSRDTKTSQRSERKSFDEQANKHLDNIDEILANMELDLGSREADNAEKDLRNDIAGMRQMLAAYGAQAGTDGVLIDDSQTSGGTDAGTMAQNYQAALMFLTSADKLFTDADAFITARSAGIEDGIRDYEDQLDNLRQASKDLLDISRDYKDQLLDAMESLDDDVTPKLDSLYDELDALRDLLKDTRGSMKDDRQAMDEYLDAVKAAVDKGRGNVSDTADALLDDEDLFSDISDDTEGRLPSKSLIKSCENHADITADYQAGGIAGTIGMEMTTDPDEDIKTTGDRSDLMTRTKAAVLTACTNDGSVLAKTSYAGGVVGAAWMGLVSSSHSFGDISVDDGDYAGGIAGTSLALIRGCSCMCTVTGDSYIGGIAGSIKNAADNTSMVHVDSTGEYLGSIAGGREDEDEGEIRGNRYVADGLGAVDGITKAAEASPIPYESLIQEKDMPQQFKFMRVTFLVDDDPVEEFTCGYGQSLDEGEIPQVPQRDGYYGHWDDTDLSRICRNTVVHAVYDPLLTAIASEDSSMPLMLAEITTNGSAVLKAAGISSADISGEAKVPARYILISAVDYSIQLFDDEALPETMRVHLKARTDAIPALASGGTLVPVKDYLRDGGYIVFDAPPTGRIYLIRPLRSWLVALCASGGAAAIALVVMLLRKKKKN